MIIEKSRNTLNIYSYSPFFMVGLYMYMYIYLKGRNEGDEF